MERFSFKPNKAEIAYRIAHVQELSTKFEQGYLKQIQKEPIWLVWRKEKQNGRDTKPPYSPRTGRLADPTNPKDWGTLPQALKALSSGWWHGIAIALPLEGWLTAIDVDNTVGGNRTVYYPGRSVMNRCESYTEISPSGHGLRLLVLGTLPENVDGFKKGGIEVYTRRHYVTLTLNHIKGTPKTIEKRQEELADIYYSFHPHDRSTPSTAPRTPSVEVVEEKKDNGHVPDIQVLEKALRGKYGDVFGRVLKGDLSDFKTPSEADYFFLYQVAYYGYQDIEQMQRMYHNYGPDRDKWNEWRGTQTYGELTIQEVVKQLQKNLAKRNGG